MDLGMDPLPHWCWWECKLCSPLDGDVAISGRKKGGGSRKERKKGGREGGREKERKSNVASDPSSAALSL